MGTVANGLVTNICGRLGGLVAWGVTLVREDQQRFLSLLSRLPARLTAEQVAWVINCQPHDVPVLVAPHLLKPLGNAPASSVKYFATVELLEHVQDRVWLVKVTNAVVRHWQTKNRQKNLGYRRRGAGSGWLQVD
jgi:hypothetical protein